MLRKLFKIFLLLGLIGAIAGGCFLTWGYFYITRDLPKLTSIEDYRPAGVTRVYSNDGTLVAEFFKQRRYPIKLKDVPPLIRNCFLAAEDASFFSHKGIDPMSILRAVVKNVETGSARQGGSTITQQVVKNLLLTPEKNIERKIKEALLSWQLEKRFSKEEILEIYLNQIYFGNTAYGIRAAAQTYFHKEPAQLTLAEGAMLASLPKAPSRYSPLLSLPRAKRRQRYVLDQMVKSSFVTSEEADTAFRDKLDVFPASLSNFYAAPYYVSEIRRVFAEHDEWKNLDIDNDTLEIHTALDLKADQLGSAALRKGLREVDKRRGWRGPIAKVPGAQVSTFIKDFQALLPQRLETDAVFPALVTEVSRAKGALKVDLGHFTADVAFKDLQWAKKFLDKHDQVSWIKPEEAITVGDVIEVSVNKREPAAKPKDSEKLMSGVSQPVAPDEIGSVVLDQTPEIEGDLVLIDPHSGKVLTTVGGYSYQRTQLNRVTQAFRQPGSAFKPVIYLTAVEAFRYTPATIVYDKPRTFRAGNEFWTPGNFDKDYLGDITLRTALQQSRNLVSADIISRIGIDPVIQYARKLGITSKLGHNLSLSLGSSEVTMLELARAYGVFASKGILFNSIFITKIVDRDGNVVFDIDKEKLNHAEQVIKEESAFIMANMMKGVVEHGTGYRVKEIGRPVAGKTGTSNDQMDGWFMGYTPSYVAGVWMGFDLKKKIGEKETGGKVAAPVWLYFMHDYLNYRDTVDYQRAVEEGKAEAQRLGIPYTPPDPVTPLDFSVPEGVEPFWVDKTTGVLSDSGNPNAIYEYFVRGTEPSKISEATEAATYLETPEL